MSNRDILAGEVGLLYPGKRDFEAITGFREDAVLAVALGLARVPSKGLLRQCIDAQAGSYCAAVVAASLALWRKRSPIRPVVNGLVALDADTSPFDNSRTH